MSETATATATTTATTQPTQADATTQQTTQQTQAPVSDYRAFIDDKGTITKPDEFFKLAGAPHLAKRFTTVEALAKSYTNAERMLSNSNKVSIPGDNSTPEEWDAFHKAIGRPETADKYELNIPEEIKGMTLDEASMTEFKGLAFKEGLKPSAVQKLADWYFSKTKTAIDTIKTQQEERHSNAIAELEKDWGKQDTPKYKEQLALAEKGAAAAGLSADVLKANPELSNNPHYIRAMAKVGAMLKEAPAANNRGQGSSTFGGDPKTEIRAIMNDPKHPYWHKGHPDHANAIATMEGLHAKLHPEAS